MERKELEEKENELKLEYESKLKELKKQFAFLNNPYKIGDIFTDHIGCIKIETIKASFGLHNSYSLPSCVYFGVELKKDMTPKKNNPKRQAWQSNDINK
jgi:hypothetical protein